MRHDNRWYSPGLIAAEVTTAAWLSSPAGDTAAAQARLARLEVEGLGADQAEAARQLVASPTAGAVVVGPAGAGKTTMLARVADAAGAHNVVATAPTAVAADTLGAALGVRSDTAARLLTAAKNNPHRSVGSNPIPAGGTVIIDEASQLATRDLAAVCGLAAAAAARVILVGDPAQQGSISAGGMFAALAESPHRHHRRPSGAVALRGPQRGRRHGPAQSRGPLRSELPPLAWAGQLRRPRRDRRRGRRLVAATRLRVHGPVRSHPRRRGGDQRRDRRTTRRRGQHRRGRHRRGSHHHPHRRHRRHPPQRPPHRRLRLRRVKNGDRWVVEGASSSGGIRLRRCDGDATAEVPLAYAAKHLQLGYAVTQTRAQSITVDAAFTVANTSTRLAELYVGLTRGARCNHLLVVTDHHGPDDDSPPEQIAPDDVLQAVFARRGHQTAAADPASGRSTRAAAAAHLAAVAAAEHTQPCRCPTPSTPPTCSPKPTRASCGAEPRTSSTTSRDAIDAWAAQLDLDEQQQHRDDSEVLAALQELRALEDHRVANSPETDQVPVQHPAAAPPEPDPLPGPAAPPPQLPPGAHQRAPTAWDLVGPGPAAAQYDALGWSGQTIAYDVFELGASNHPTRQLLESHPAPARLAPDDNVSLVELVAAYQRSEHAGDVGAAARLWALTAAVADPPLRRRLQHHRDIGADPDSLSPGDSQWARSVRHDVLHRRAAAWTPALDALETRRETLRTRVRAAIEAGAFNAAVTSEALCAHDRTLWAARCLLWLDSDATAEGLLNIWAQTNSSLAAVAAGDAAPCTANSPDSDKEPPWRTLAAASPATPAPTPLPQGSPGYSYQVPATALDRTRPPDPAPRPAMPPSGTTTNCSTPPTRPRPATTSSAAASNPTTGTAGRSAGPPTDGGRHQPHPRRPRRPRRRHRRPSQQRPRLRHLTTRAPTNAKYCGSISSHFGMSELNGTAIDPTVNTPNAAMKPVRNPIRSATLPMSGIAAVKPMRYPVTAQEARSSSPGPIFMSAMISGSTVTITV